MICARIKGKNERHTTKSSLHCIIWDSLLSLLEWMLFKKVANNFGSPYGYPKFWVAKKLQHTRLTLGGQSCTKCVSASTYSESLMSKSNLLSASKKFFGLHVICCLKIIKVLRARLANLLIFQQSSWLPFVKLISLSSNHFFIEKLNKETERLPTNFTSI